MNRKIIQELIEWKARDDRKPLILFGAPRVGKTWIMKEFGKAYYDNYVYFNFLEEKGLNQIFNTSKNPNKIILALSIISGKKIIPGKTLIIFDDIQACPDALNALKYFKEEANEYHIVSALTLLKTNINSSCSYPVGMVNILHVYPLSFEEFLEAIDLKLYKYYETITKHTIIEEIFHNRLLELYDYYLIIGGMPECVASWIKYKDVKRISQMQNHLIKIYESEFQNNNGKVNSNKLVSVFRSIVIQLAKFNEKFFYEVVRKGGRARNFEEAIEWLKSTGIVNKLNNVSKIEHPLTAFDKISEFKLFLLDTGLLKKMAEIDNSAILLKNDYKFKGPLTENYVLQQLIGQFEAGPRYYSEKNQELDFILQNGMEIIPVEVKGGADKSAGSFKKYIADRKPSVAIRYSRLGYRTDGNITNIPLYLACRTKDLI